MPVALTERVEAIAANFDSLSEFLMAFDEVVVSAQDEECVILRSMLDDLLGQVRGAVGDVDRRVLELVAPGQSVTAPGFGQLVVEAKGKQTTHGGKLARVLAARIADTPANEDGEKVPPAVLCEKTADEIVIVFGLDTPSTSFRSTEVKNRGLRSGEFRDFEDGQPKVRFLR